MLNYEIYKVQKKKKIHQNQNSSGLIKIHKKIVRNYWNS